MTSTKQESVWEYPRQPRVEDWYYPEPVERYAEITNCVAFYSARVDAFMSTRSTCGPSQKPTTVAG
jgi:hypothetical protein